MTHTHGIFTFTLRPAVEDDLAYILDTWLEGMAGEYRDVRKGDYEREGRRHILGILQRPSVMVVVASPQDQPSVIWAYLVGEAGLLHWCYVRRTHRRLGIARRLVSVVTPPELVTDAERDARKDEGRRPPTPTHVVTHMTGVLRKIKSTHKDAFRYLPWLANPQGEPDVAEDATRPETPAS